MRGQQAIRWNEWAWHCGVAIYLQTPPMINIWQHCCVVSFTNNSTSLESCFAIHPLFALKIADATIYPLLFRKIYWWKWKDFTQSLWWSTYKSDTLLPIIYSYSNVWQSIKHLQRTFIAWTTRIVTGHMISSSLIYSTKVHFISKIEWFCLMYTFSNIRITLATTLHCLQFFTFLLLASYPYNSMICY